MASYEVVYSGKALSLNSVKSQHWRQTEKQKNGLKDVLMVLLLQAKIKHMHRYRIDVWYNSRLDPDNVTPMLKLVCDLIRRKGYAIDDSKKYWKGFSVTPDETLPPNTYRFLISEVQ